MLQMELEPASALIGQEATRHKGQCSQSIRAFVRAATQCCKVSQSALNFECVMRRRSWLSSVGRAKAIGRRWRAGSQCSQASRRRGIRTRTHSPGTAAERAEWLAVGVEWSAVIYLNFRFIIGLVQL